VTNEDFIEQLRELDPRDLQNELGNEDVQVAVTVTLAQVDTISIPRREAEATVDVCVDDVLSELAEHGFLAEHIVSAYRKDAPTTVASIATGGTA
jgi:hypothetical protein